MLFGKYDYKTDLRVKQEEAYEERMAKQKAEDEKLINQLSAEIKTQAEENRRLQEEIKKTKINAC